MVGQRALGASAKVSAINWGRVVRSARWMVLGSIALSAGVAGIVAECSVGVVCIVVTVYDVVCALFVVALSVGGVH